MKSDTPINKSDKEKARRRESSTPPPPLMCVYWESHPQVNFLNIKFLSPKLPSPPFKCALVNLYVAILRVS